VGLRLPPRRKTVLTRLMGRRSTRKVDPDANLQFQELRDGAVAERCSPRRFQRSRPGPPFSGQLLRWHIGWKRSNKLTESGSWVLSSG
jgi:hypothetical protein